MSRAPTAPSFFIGSFSSPKDIFLGSDGQSTHPSENLCSRRRLRSPARTWISSELGKALTSIFRNSSSFDGAPGTAKKNLTLSLWPWKESWAWVRLQYGMNVFPAAFDFCKNRDTRKGEGADRPRPPCPRLARVLQARRVS